MVPGVSADSTSCCPLGKGWCALARPLSACPSARWKCTPYTLTHTHTHTHLALVHVSWALVAVGERGEASHNAEHGARPQLTVRGVLVDAASHMTRTHVRTRELYIEVGFIWSDTDVHEHLFKAADELQGACGQVPDGPHHAGRGGEEEEAGVPSPPPPVTHQAYLQAGGHLQ